MTVCRIVLMSVCRIVLMFICRFFFSFFWGEGGWGDYYPTSLSMPPHGIDDKEFFKTRNEPGKDPQNVPTRRFNPQPSLRICERFNQGNLYILRSIYTCNFPKSSPWPTGTIFGKKKRSMQQFNKRVRFEGFQTSQYFPNM